MALPIKVQHYQVSKQHPPPWRWHCMLSCEAAQRPASSLTTSRMAVKRITSEIGHSAPPEGPHTITVHVPGWDNALKFRDGDKELFSKIRSLYPRFAPFGLARQLTAAIGSKLGLEAREEGVVVFTDPAAFPNHKTYSLSPYRKDKKLSDGDLAFKVVDIHGVRLYCVVYPMSKTPGVVGVWQNTGTGVLSRLAEELLKHVDTDFQVVEWAGDDITQVPPPTYLPECGAHDQLRKRIQGFLNRQPLDPRRACVKDTDVYLYSTGMAAIYRLNEVLVQRDPGTILVVGSIFHNTYHLFEEAPGGLQHFGAAGATSGVLDKVEAYLSQHYQQGKTVSYLFVEFPSNPILVSADLNRLRAIADKYSFPMVVDDTISSFANVDVFPVADLIMTSLTKSFSGYADVMAGSVVLNPHSRFYHTALKPLFTKAFHNELFAGDAETLLANSADYFARTRILNRNAASLAALLATKASDPSSPVTHVLYPSTSDTRHNYEAFMRPVGPEQETGESFTPGYGCLLSVDFESLTTVRAFYDNLEFHCGPHLGAHRTLAMCFNAVVYGRDPEEGKYHASYGVRPEQIRISVGLESEEEILAAVEYALDKADEAFRAAKKVHGLDAQKLLDKTSTSDSSNEDVVTVAEGTRANYEG